MIKPVVHSSGTILNKLIEDVCVNCYEQTYNLLLGARALGLIVNADIFRAIKQNPLLYLEQQYIVKIFYQMHTWWFYKLHNSDVCKQVSLISLIDQLAKRTRNEQQQQTLNELKLTVIRNSTLNKLNYNSNFSQITIPTVLKAKNVIKKLYSQSNTKFLDLQIEKIGDIMHYLSLDLIKSINFDEFNHCKWMKSDKYKLAKTVMKVIDFHNFLCAKLATEILLEKKLVHCYLGKVIELAQYFQKLNNFELLSAVINCINSYPVSRLKEAKETLPKKYIMILEEIEPQVSPVSNYVTYRQSIQHLSDNKVSYIPIIAVILKDIASIDIQPNYVDSSPSTDNISHSNAMMAGLPTSRTMSKSKDEDKPIKSRKLIGQASSFNVLPTKTLESGPLKRISSSPNSNEVIQICNYDKIITFGKVLHQIVQIQTEPLSLETIKNIYSIDNISFVCDLMHVAPADEECLIQFSYEIERPKESSLCNNNDNCFTTPQINQLPSEEVANILSITEHKDPYMWNKVELRVNFKEWGLPDDVCDSLLSDAIPDGKSFMEFKEFSTIKQIGFRKLVQRKINHYNEQIKLKLAHEELEQESSVLGSSSSNSKPLMKNASVSSGSVPPGGLPKELNEDQFKLWNNQEVLNWLEASGYGDYKSCFLSFTGKDLVALNSDRLTEIGVSILGHRKGILRSLGKSSLHRRNSQPVNSLQSGKALVPQKSSKSIDIHDITRQSTLHKEEKARR